jgi:DNA-binding GntR family transcriptional regulator
MSPPRAPARRTMLRDEIRTVLTARIMDGTYGPGERLVEMRIAKEFGVSQSPVREAIRDLASLRLITHEPYRGTRVRALSLGELRAVVPVREALEVVAVRLGMARLSADLSPLRERLEAMRQAAAKGDRHAFAVNDAGFHASLVAAADNPVLRDAWEVVGAARHVFVTASRLDLDLGVLAETHVAIIAACARGDAEEAAAELHAHLRRYGLDPMEAAASEVEPPGSG